MSKLAASIRIQLPSKTKLWFVILCVVVFGCAQQAPQPAKKSEPVIHVQEITIAQIKLGLRSGSFTCKKLVETYLERIKRFDQPTKLNAFTHINKNALNRAERLDLEWKREQKLRELHCVPVVIKDNFDTADMPTTAGSKVLANSYPPDDAYMVRRLREAGAIVIGKSNMAEWAFSPYFTISSTAGTTRNPYDLSRVPAGSSGGTAAATAANLAAVGMGTDTGNSIRGPASHTALVGIRSTLGSTSRDGIVPLLKNRDVAGPLTRTVEDAARVFNIVAGFDPADPLTRKAMNRLPADYTKFLNKDGLNKVRLGVLRALSNTQTEDPEILALFEKAIVDLRGLGAVIVDPIEIKDFTKHRTSNDFCSAFLWDVNEYFRSLGDKAPVQSFKQVIRSGRYHPSSRWGIDWVKSTKKPPEQQKPPCLGVEKDPRRAEFLAEVLRTMDKYKISAIIYPTWNNPPRKIDDLDSPHGNNSPVISPHTGQPSITVPMGFTKSELPAGLQFLARPFEEAKLFQYAYAYEQATHHRKPPKQFSE